MAVDNEQLNDLAELAFWRTSREAGEPEIAAVALGAAFVNACEVDGWDIDRAIEFVRSTFIEERAAKNRGVHS